MRQWLMLGAALAVAGCQTAAEAPKAPPPSNYRAMVADYIRKSFKDPYSIRDASIAAPVSGVSLIGQVWTVCVMANSKNSFGAYTGVKPITFLFNNGVITGSDEEYAAITCTGLAYQPFPEIEEKKR